MTCTRIPSGIICTTPSYRWEGWYFEWHAYCGPALLKRNGDPKPSAPMAFWTAMNRFGALPETERNKYRVSK